MSAPLLHASGVEKAFLLGEVRTPVLRGVSARLEPGRLAAIVGPSGSGKSTFLALLGGLDRADAGELVVDGVDLRAARPSELVAYRREKVGFVFQFYNLLPSLTAVENVEASLGFLRLPARERRRRAMEALDAVRLADAGHKFPSQLSGGMQQRVAIARAICRRPALLLADEPTGNLDREAGALVLAELRALQRSLGVTVIVVTHDPGLAAQADVVFTMSDGRLAEPGGAQGGPAAERVAS